jgi:hypothetical protein
MATNTIDVAGDSSQLLIQATNLSGLDPLEFLSGSFRSSPEERRVCTVFFIAAGGTEPFQLRFEFTSPLFIEHSVTGKPVYRTQDAL